MSLERCKEAAALYRRKRQLTDELHDVNARLAAALSGAAEELVEAGVPRLPINGAIIHFSTVASVKVRRGRDGEPLAPREPIPEPVARSLRAALNRLGIGALVKPQLNKRGLSAWVAEQVEEGRGVPQSLRRWLVVEAQRVPRIMADSAENDKRSQAQSLDEALGEGAVE